MKSIISLDIGGTNTRIGLLEISQSQNKIMIAVKKKKKYLTESIIKKLGKSNQTSSITMFSEAVSSIIKKFGKESKAKTSNIAIGFAGPVSGKRPKLSNLGMALDIDLLREKTKASSVNIINDFSANAYGFPFIKKKDIFVLQKGISKPNPKVIMLLGAGTGLGKSYIIDNRVYSCEPGWTLVGIKDIDDYALLDYFKGKLSRTPYYEDLVSASGLVNIYKYLEIKYNLAKKSIKSSPDTKLIIKYGKKDKLAGISIARFMDFYSRFARDSCLGLIPDEVYLTGGLSAALKPFFEKYFLKGFLDNARHKALLKKIRISLVLNEDIGLLGAAAFAAGLKKNSLN